MQHSTSVRSYHSPRLPSPSGFRRSGFSPHSALSSLSLSGTRAEAERAAAAARAKAYPSPPMSSSPSSPSPKHTHEAGDRTEGGSSYYHYQIPQKYRQGTAATATTPTRHDATSTSTATTTATTTATLPLSIDLQQQPSGAFASSYDSPAPLYSLQQPPHQRQLLSQPPSILQPQPQPQPQSSLTHLGRPFQAEMQDRLPYPPYGGRPDEAGLPPPQPPPATLSDPYQPSQEYYHLQHAHHPGHAVSGYPSYLPPLPGPTSMQQGYPPSSLPPGPIQIPSPVGPCGSGDASGPYESPRTQRKAKGHVASACVPCKKAHLRCDAQRPCSRCLSNGKEDACVDVQHKKRGRPRLREERELGYDYTGRPGLGDVGIRRTTPLFYGTPATAMGSGYGVSTARRGHASATSYRVLKSHRADPVLPRFIERSAAAAATATTSDASGSMHGIYRHPPPLSISTRQPEPAAYLTMEMEISRASDTFTDAVGRPSVKGQSLLDLVVPAERDRVLALRRQMQEERQRKDPQYLPPIFVQRDEQRVLQSLGFASEDLARFSLDWQQEFLAFGAVDGQQRTFPVRIGLAKQDSIYFVVLVLQVALRPLIPSHATPSPHPRDLPFAYSYQQSQPPPPQHQQQQPYPPAQQQQQHQQQQMYSRPTPVSATFEAGRPRKGNDAGAMALLQQQQTARRSGGVAGASSADPSPVMAGLSPSMSTAYGPSPGWSEFSSGPPTYQTPRSELSHRQMLLQQPSQQHLQQQQQYQPAIGGSGYQLPPIRNQHESFVPVTRDDKSRVDIGGLIDRPDDRQRLE